jgi:O-succinylbenzoate synthase
MADLAQGARIEYLEEPVRTVADLAAFRVRSAIPLALDESLGELGAEGAAPLGAVAWIIKPSLRGGIAASLALAQAARRAGAVPVVSSAFETGVGRRAVAQLAALIHDGDCAAGLDTGSWFVTDVMAAPLAVIDGEIDVDAMPGTAYG